LQVSDGMQARSDSLDSGMSPETLLNSDVETWF
jgi:hypothetical protein